MFKILAIIPAYNESGSIGPLIKKVRDENLISDLVVVNDCSTDNTAEIVKGLGEKVLNLPVNLGIGGAMQTGYIYAKDNNYDFAIQIDGDGQHLPSEVKKLLNCYEKTKSDLVIGSRFLSESGYSQTLSRRLGIMWFAVLTKLLINNSIKDSTSGFRLANKKVIELFSCYYPTDYPEPEVLVYLNNNGCKISETSVQMVNRETGTSSINKLKPLYYMLKVTASMLLQKIRRKDA